ncbi:MAG: hypothetical protein DRJ38_04645, partial [Thermoprotei archaeon]
YKLYFVYLKSDPESMIAIRNAFKELGLEDKLIDTVSDETYKRIVEEGFKPALAHPAAVNELAETLKKYLG